MNIYFSGISGTALAPLALLATHAGHQVFGSDLAQGAAADELAEQGLDTHYGPQDGIFLKKQFTEKGIDWFVYTSALPSDHTELQLAKQLGIKKITKRDALLSEIIATNHLKLVAIAGTHGKTTTTAMLIWTCHQLSIPISYSVGSTLPWAKSGDFNPSAQYFIYEADEYDRNFLHFHPQISLITTEDYDHTDTYPTRESYHQAFAQFRAQSDTVIENTPEIPSITLVGELRRKDASLAFQALKLISNTNDVSIIAALNTFPGAGRRFEKLTDNIYSDYAHHPQEISATLKMARELVDQSGFASLTILYQPHQNTRQHEILSAYHNAFDQADQILWLPTYLTREDPNLSILAPKDFIATLSNPQKATAVDLNDSLIQTLSDLTAQNHLILLMSAGPADPWLRNAIKNPPK
ncbi:MAG: Mur ligase domain-containing protein [Candidatus Nomurabacteria bacterium]|jgi:UDP-N-acetylmuramate--alanine ligase|nr:Mur ligase domain-containing protein [Candidatus Nomurabacteria bacterium]